MRVQLRHRRGWEQREHSFRCTKNTVDNEQRALLVEGLPIDKLLSHACTVILGRDVAHTLLAVFAFDAANDLFHCARKQRLEYGNEEYLEYLAPDLHEWPA